jgi:hypothetical protein
MFGAPGRAVCRTDSRCPFANGANAQAAIPIAIPAIALRESHCCDDVRIENAANTSDAAARQTAAFITGDSRPPVASPSAAIETSETAIASARFSRRVAKRTAIAIGKSTQNVAIAATTNSNAASPIQRKLRSGWTQPGADASRFQSS